MIHEDPASRRWLCRAAVVVAVVAVVTYAPTLDFGFAYDDEWTIVHNRHLERDLATLLRASFAGEGRAQGIPDATRPLMIASIWIDHRLFGLQPAGFHLHSLVLYAMCSVAALFAAYAITRRRGTALLAAIFFAVAPIHAEVVSAVNYREDLLASLSTLSVFAWFAWPHRRPDTLDGAVVAGGAFGLGLLAKATALVLLPLVGTWWVVLGHPGSDRRGRLPTLASVGVVASVWAAWRGWLRLTGRDDVPGVPDATSLQTRMASTARYEVRSLIDATWPASWAPDHPPESAASGVSVVVLILIVVASLVAARRRAWRRAAFSTAWIAIASSVTSPLVGPVNAWADRYLFASVLGAGCLWAMGVRAVAAAARRRWPRRGWMRPSHTVGLAALAMCLVAIPEARRAGAIWQSNASLWRAGVERQPTSARAWTALSRQLRSEGDLDGADRSVRRAIELDPGLLRARVTAIYNALARGDVAQARRGIRELERAGGASQLGMRQARRCSRLTPEQAAACVGFGARGGLSPPVAESSD